MLKTIYSAILQVVIIAHVIAGETATHSVTPPKLTTKPSPRTVVWEAEWANRLTGTFELLPDSNCSGQGALWAREGSGRQNGGEASYLSNNSIIEMGIADYYINVPRSGRYQIYMRLWAMDKCGNSCWVSIDDTAASSMRYFPGGKTGRLGSFRHNDWPDGSLETWIWATDETITYPLKRGTHHMRIKVREDGFAIDQIALLPVGAPMPSEKLSCTDVPGKDGLPPGVSFSLHSQTSPSSNRPTPFDVYFTINDLIVSGTPLSTKGYAWIRLNANQPATVSLSVQAPGIAIAPTTCTLTPDAPLAVVPVTINLPADSHRRTYKVTATATADAWPNLRINREHTIKHRLDWVISPPVTYNMASQVFRDLKMSRPTSLESLPSKVSWSRLNWKRPRAGKDYNRFGAIDLGSMYGEHTEKAVVAATWVTVKEAARLAVFGGGDDKLTLYADSRHIMGDYRNCPLTDSIKLHPVVLNKGKVLLVATCYQSRNWWQFQIDFRDKNGEPTDAVVGHTWK